MATSAIMIRVTFLALLVASPTFASVKHMKILNRIAAATHGADCLHEETEGALFSTTAAPLGLGPVPYGAAPYSSIPSAFPLSTAAPLFDATLGGSTAATLIGSSTPAPLMASATLIGSSTPAPLLAADYEALPLQSRGPFLPPSPQQVALNRLPAYATAYGAAYSAYAPAYEHGVQITETDRSEAAMVSVDRAPAPHHQITINREVPVPYYVQVEKKIPYPVLVRVPHPYPVTVEKHVPYAVRVNVDRPVPVPHPYPVEVEKRVPYPVERPVPVEVRVPVDRPYPVRVAVERPVPYAVEKPVPYPVRVNVDRPYPVETRVPYPVPVEKPVPFPVERRVPYPVMKPVPYAVEKPVPYPVRYDVPVNVPVPVGVGVPVPVDRPVPFPVEKKVPYPVQVPYGVKVPVPVSGPTQRFATVHYYQQQSPAIVGAAAMYDSAAISGHSIGGQSVGYETSGPAGFYGTSIPAPFASDESYGTAIGSNSMLGSVFDSQKSSEELAGLSAQIGYGQQLTFGPSIGGTSHSATVGSKLMSRDGYVQMQKSSELVGSSSGFGRQETAEIIGSSTTMAPAPFGSGAAVSSEFSARQIVQARGDISLETESLESGKK